jgi:hypothetical protein
VHRSAGQNKQHLKDPAFDSCKIICSRPVYTNNENSCRAVSCDTMRPKSGSILTVSCMVLYNTVWHKNPVSCKWAFN